MKTFEQLAAVLSISPLAGIGAQPVVAAEQADGIGMTEACLMARPTDGTKLNGASLDGRLAPGGHVFAVTLPASVGPVSTRRIGTW